MKLTTLPSQDVLQKLLEYNPDTGVLRWKPRETSEFVPTPKRTAEWQQRWWNARFAGCIAGTLSDEGYLCARINGTTYKVHRLVWKLTHGVDPEFIDHVNGNRIDNRIENLRSISFVANRKNAGVPTNNTSGILGVDRRNGKWRARITHNKELIELGQFPTEAEAVAARRAAEKMFGYHENHGQRMAIPARRTQSA